jgi:hypothetical protein
MPINLIAEIVPKNAGQFALLDDAYLRGGFHVVDNLTTRNSISVDRRKYGMRIAVQSTDLVYKLESDLTTWTVDQIATVALQQAYNAGAEIITTSGNPVILTGSDTISTIFTIRNQTSDILKVGADKIVEFNQTLKGKDYTTSITSNVNANNSDIILDITDRSIYRAIQYFYTCQNSDATGYETGQIYLIHDGINVTIYWQVGVTTGIPTGLIFNAQMIGANISLLATTDNSTSASRVIHLFKIVLL